MARKSFKRFASASMGVLIALSLTGCMPYDRQVYTATISPNGDLSGSYTVAMQPDYIQTYIASTTPTMSNSPLVASVTSTSHAVSASDCIISGAEIGFLPIDNAFPPVPGMQVVIPNYDDANYASGTQLQGTITSVVDSTSSDGLFWISFTSLTAVGKAGACLNLQAPVTGGTIFTGNSSWANKLRSGWSAIDALKAFNHISASDYPYYIALRELMFAGNHLRDNAEATQAMAQIEAKSTLDDLIMARQHSGDFAEAIDQVSGLSTFDSSGVKGVALSFRITLADTTTRIGGNTALPSFAQSGNVWTLTQDMTALLENPNADDQTPQGDLERSARHWAGWNQSFTVNGVVLECNCTWSGSTATWSMSDLANTSASSNPNAAPSMKVIPGYRVSFSNGSSGSNKKVKNALKSNSATFKNATSVTVIAVKDGHLANAAKIARNATLAKNRANRVKAQLKALGVNASKISISYETSGSSTSDSASKAAVNQVVVKVS